MSPCLRLQIAGPKNLLIFSINNVFCYLLYYVIQHDIHESLEEILIGAKWKWKWKLKYNISFLWHSTTFTLEFGLCMKLEDVLEVLPILILENFLDQFIFI